MPWLNDINMGRGGHVCWGLQQGMAGEWVSRGAVGIRRSSSSGIQRRGHGRRRELRGGALSSPRCQRGWVPYIALHFMWQVEPAWYSINRLAISLLPINDHLSQDHPRVLTFHLKDKICCVTNRQDSQKVWVQVEFHTQWKILEHIQEMRFLCGCRSSFILNGKYWNTSKRWDFCV
jgi:hypothetical protein